MKNDIKFWSENTKGRDLGGRVDLRTIEWKVIDCVLNLTNSGYGPVADC
jgi:hypothetical protein